MSPGGVATERLRSPQPPFVEASLLAIAVGQFALILDVPPSSRASPLPHWFWGGAQNLHPPQLPCGSGLARDSGGSAGRDVGCAAVFAGKPAPTLVWGVHRAYIHHNSPVGASLLAMTAAQSIPMQAEPPLSRASSAPTGFALRSIRSVRPPSIRGSIPGSGRRCVSSDGSTRRTPNGCHYAPHAAKRH
ncbi:hypothetical protein SAMN03159439_05534 [Pseudomonas sp. NFACC04-2]|nr:hypothetical protein SAMN03159439_05534 [Pseudomonas sp. NFACC04-2]